MSMVSESTPDSDSVYAHKHEEWDRQAEMEAQALEQALRHPNDPGDRPVGPGTGR